MTRDQRHAVWALALGLLVIYAGVFYAYPAMLPDLLAETGWSKATLAFGPTLGALVMAALTPVTGRVVDRGHGAALMIWMPVLAVVCVGALGFVTRPWQWWAVWALMGVAQAGCLYESTFAILARHLGPHARQGITRITLVAGLSGTMTFPLGHYLAGALGGQGAYPVFALMTLVITVPLNLYAMKRLGRGESPKHEAAQGALRAALARWEFWGIAGIFALIWLDHGILLTYILPLFEDRGVSREAAAFAAACLGPAQLVGRLVLVVGGGRVTNGAATRVSVLAIAVAGGLLILAGAAPMLVFVVVAVQGAGVGLMSIMRPMLVAEVLGRRGFGAVSGASAVPPILATAAAPSLGAFLLDGFGTGAVYAALLGFALAALVLAVFVTRRPGAAG